MRSVIDYAAPVFFNGLPQYLKKELVRLEKRAVSIITSGKCNSAIEVGLTPILEHYYVLCSRLFDNIVRDPNHKLKALLPPIYLSIYLSISLSLSLYPRAFARVLRMIEKLCNHLIRSFMVRLRILYSRFKDRHICFEVIKTIFNFVNESPPLFFYSLNRSPRDVAQTHMVDVKISSHLLLRC